MARHLFLLYRFCYTVIGVKLKRRFELHTGRAHMVGGWARLLVIAL
jgi:hypothetical protein